MPRLTLNGMYEWDPSIFDGMILPEDYDRNALLFEILQRSGQLYPYHQQPFILKEGIRLWFARNYLGFDRTMAALMAEYNPIENYDRHEKWTRTPDLTDEETNKGKDTQAATGKDTLALSGTDTVEQSGTDTVADSGSDTTTRSHTDYHEDTEHTYTNYKESNTKTGTDTTERTVSAFDSSAYTPAEKTVETFGSIKDEKAITGSHNDDKAITGSYSDETEYGKSEDTTYGKTEETTYGRSEDTTYGRTDTTTYGKTTTGRHTGKEDFESRVHGNIGVTTNQQMAMSEVEFRRFDIYVDIAKRFEHEFLVQVY